MWARALDAAGKPERIRVERFHPPTDRGLDIDVVQDFMLHDLDCVRRYLPGDLTSLEATGRRVANDRLDEAQVRLVLAGGVRVELAASRVHAEKRRRVEIEGTSGQVVGDLLAGTIQRVEGEPITASASSSGLAEPLDRQLADFLDACVGRTRPENDGAEGVASLELVDRVRDAIGQGA